jgi:hypothetical protein
MGLELLLEAHPCGEIHNFNNQPVVLPIADPKTIADEVQRVGAIHRHEYRGRPGEI